jgi:hypothetical protein
MGALHTESARADAIFARAPTGSGDLPGLAEQRAVMRKRVADRTGDLEIISFPGLLSYPNPPAEGAKYLTLLGAMNHPWSRGSIHAGSKNALEHPLIDPHYFEEEIGTCRSLGLCPARAIRRR